MHIPPFSIYIANNYVKSSHEPLILFYWKAYSSRVGQERENPQIEQKKCKKPDIQATSPAC